MEEKQKKENVLEVPAKIKYFEAYLPTKRHRKYRYKEVSETITVELPKVSREDLKLAFIVTDYQSHKTENGGDVFGLVDRNYYAYNGKLYVQKMEQNGALIIGKYPLDTLKKVIEGYGERCFPIRNESVLSKEYVLNYVTDFIEAFLIVDDEVYVEAGEPMYFIETFGLGNNHGGTSLFIVDVNPKYKDPEYFYDANHREQALKHLDETAAARGDTKSVGKHREKNIRVLMPEIMLDHNQIELREYLIEQGLTEDEARGILSEMDDNVSEDDLNVSAIYDSLFAFAESYIDNCIGELDHYINEFLDYSDFGRFVAENEDDCYITCDDRVVRFEM